MNPAPEDKINKQKEILQKALGPAYRVPGQKETKRPAGQDTNPGFKPNNILFIVFCLTIVAAICTLIFSTLAFTQFIDAMAQRRRYAPLQEMANEMIDELTREQTTDNQTPQEQQETEDTYLSPFDAQLRMINPDYICWIRIEDTSVNYPVVRGADNERYLDTSFSGVKNSLGTLFMDYRCAGEYVPNIIIFGHNARGGDMFGGLRSFLDDNYLKAHPVITIIVNERITEYEIFSARRTNVSDPAYYIDFREPGAFAEYKQRIGAPEGAAQIITLSTCVSAGDDDERVVVQGVLRR